MSQSQIRRVALLVYPQAEYDRGLVHGIGQYASLHGTWIFHLAEEYRGMPRLEYEATNAVFVDVAQPAKPHSRVSLADLKKLGVMGVIGRIQTPAIADWVLSSGVPVIAMDRSSMQLADDDPLSRVSEVCPDSHRAGRLAAEHLLECGFNQFAFCGFAGRLWSQHRQDGFVERLQEACFPCGIYELPSRRSRWDWNRELPLVQDWLKALPKPVGVMAANDLRGRQLLDVCSLAEIRVPDDVAVVGVDNDSIMCDLANPPLSSVALNAERGGYQAAELLDAMISGETQEPQQILVEPIRVAARRSTDVIAVDDRNVADALRFIRWNARWAIGVEDVVDSVGGVSRRSLEMRFQRAIGRSIREEIQRFRLLLAKRLLIETDLSLSKISEAIGFNSVSYLAKVFRREEKITLLEYRHRLSRGKP